MAPVLDTPRPRVRSSARPNKRPISDSVPLPKRRKYAPGGPGGGGRFVENAGLETPVGGSGSGGYPYTSSRSRTGRTAADRHGIHTSAHSPSYSRPRRERAPAGPRSSSAAAVAAAVAHNDGYKPREERGWEEFHQTLDIDAELPIFSADQIDGISPPESAPGTPLNGSSSAQFAITNGISAQLEGIHAQQAAQESPVSNGSLNTPRKRGPGRPPRKLDSMLNGLGSPPRPRINPLPTQNPREKLNLPKPSTREVDPFTAYEESEGRVNYVDRTMASVGYQESEIFQIPPDALIRVPEGSIEEDLDLMLKTEGEGSTAVAVGRVEYDMDEQDDRWLDTLNAQRREEGVEAIKPAIFEVTISQIEKEWHALEKRIPKPNPKPPQTHRPRSSSAAAVNGEPAGQGEEQDTKCAICDDGDCENTNAIVFCDGCDLAVHQECYGVPFIPEGQWLCRRCQLVGRGTPVSEQPGCIFCPNPDGAFKQTTAMKWAHLLCAMWIPEVSLANTTFQEPVQDVEKVPKTRWKLTCYICKQKMGACIQCGHKSCFEAFHVTCARKARLCLRMKQSSSHNALDASVLKAYCDRHSPSDWRRENDVEINLAMAKREYRSMFKHVRWGDSQAYALSLGSSHAVPSIEGLDDEDATTGNKRKRGQPGKSWRLPSGAPVVPQIVYNNVEMALIKFNVRKRKEFVQEACKYWTLKREARRGAALLKRLQLQMDAFSSMEITRRNFVGMGAAGRPRLHRRIEFAEQLEKDMERVRDLCALIKQRESEKLKDVQILKSILDTIYFPLSPILGKIVEKALAYDTKDVFKEGILEVQAKVLRKYYTSVQGFSEDMAAVFTSVIDFTTITNVLDAEQQLSDVAHESLTTEQKEKKKLAKRIIRGLQPLFDEALRNESDLAGRPFEREIPNLEALLDQKLRKSESHSLNGEEVHQIAEDVASGAAKGEIQEQHNGSETAAVKDESSLHLAPTPEENADDQQGIRDEAADEAAIAAQLGQDAIMGVPTHERMQIDGEVAGGQAAPPTPPGSDQDLLGPIHHGGVPWYLKEFDPEGTTVHEERWTGREVLRDMSEELSELDDDELNDLADPESLAPVEGASGENAPAPATLQKATVRRQKRRRNW
ncbi:hypothetical protein DM02DRAFT_670616 [Periconia macrospinosa]|uniref:PHD finger domain-containing protein n=1 Tax=Periconia macrospinosa TaxID=97972 RepID=A0A2V1DYB4_9PLEO|nr:hypothetical protein DM02DRAFT_670616 [Periconia macrospinosa]